jgi:hypothetical protein
LTDKWFERTLEKAGEGIVGAKVEIDKLDFSILDYLSSGIDCRLLIQR